MQGRIIFSKPSMYGSCVHIMLLILFRSSKFRNAVMSSSGGGEDSLTFQLTNVFQSMKNANVTSSNGDAIVSTDKIWELIGVEKLGTIDASELFIAMSELIDSENPSLTPALKSFGFTVDNEIVSLVDNHKRVDKLEDNYILGLTIPVGARNISSLMKHHFAFETLKVEEGLGYLFQTGDVENEDDVNITPEDVEKGCVLASLPNETFVVQLQRFTYDFVQYTNVKIDDKVTFPKKLSGSDLAKACCGSKDEWHQKSYDRVSKVKEVELYAIITHQTNHGYSGFICMEDGKWYHLNEMDTLAECTEAEALEVAYGDGTHGSINGYILFYSVVGGPYPENITGAISALLEKPIPPKKTDDSKTKAIQPQATPSAVSVYVSPESAKQNAQNGGSCCTIL